MLQVRCLKARGLQYRCWANAAQHIQVSELEVDTQQLSALKSACVAQQWHSLLRHHRWWGVMFGPVLANISL
jgi:hypothetical protein